MSTPNDKVPADETVLLLNALRVLAEAVALHKPATPGHVKRGQVLTPPETADFLRVSEAAVRRSAVLGEIPSQFIDGDWRFSSDALMAWLSCGWFDETSEDGHQRYPRPVSDVVRTENTEREADEFLAQLDRLHRIEQEAFAPDEAGEQT